MAQPNRLPADAPHSFGGAALDRGKPLSFKLDGRTIEGFAGDTVLTALLPHRPGELARLTRLVADAGVNIDAIYVLRSNAEGIEFAISIDQADEAVPELPITGGVLVV